AVWGETTSKGRRNRSPGIGHSPAGNDLFVKRPAVREVIAEKLDILDFRPHGILLRLDEHPAEDPVLAADRSDDHRAAAEHANGEPPLSAGFEAHVIGAASTAAADIENVVA